ncbi:NADH-quinone oxidoreductase subunit NuoH [Desulfobulbus oligotrophicus]|jgi:NADH-quinone oxidoreductase subunit H|uniref:NADH-quinone oxidoreductase subunit H n=1 Tax=Desulfobulbus oligotrophicus TaxID=1909699 RepID=A0A7T6AQT3_9BACT|nr:NADH-quinone oxidoreductase subunit NuoH [Desulfobulbus oligotrophicus]MDY0390433.1 NADH-quinone oxidoreductase subunit NuoH [Desulfobulbus oligotrophicus]QQG65793.1 NADH-quinone oxidoreductase subunit NuoH [Desulfobulbus oligotrophicus]
METSVWRALLYLVGIMVFAGLNAAYLGWCERKGAGRIQRRIGPCEVGYAGLLQPIADGVKLLSKQLLVPRGVDHILFRTAPVLAMIPAMTSMVAIPFSANIQARAIELSVLLLFALASIGMMAVLLGGWASGNKYAIISSARAVSQNLAYEIPMLVTVITVVLLTGSLELREIALKQQGGFWHWNVFRLENGHFLTMWISFIIFFICSVAETNRAPFDMAEAESELVAGYMTEYSSMGFGLFMMGEYLNIVVGACLTTTLFLGGWDCPLGLTPGVWWFLIKIYILIFTFIWIRWTYPRTQIYKLLNLSWKFLIPFSFANLLITAALIKVF